MCLGSFVQKKAQRVPLRLRKREEGPRREWARGKAPRPGRTGRRQHKELRDEESGEKEAVRQSAWRSRRKAW